MTETIHIIEPTLVAKAGHCFSFVASLCQAAGEFPLTIWCGRSAKIEFKDNVRINPFFIRKLRRLQSLWLYRKLLRQDGRLFVSTAGRTDLILLNLASRDAIPANKMFLYVHWFRTSSAKRRQLEKIARRQPNIVILTPTASVLEEFRSAGFIHSRLIPYPITQREADLTTPDSGFRQLLFAGAARRDKGFSAVVDLVELLAQKGLELPVTLQTSADHYNKYDDSTLQDLKRLENCRYPFLKKQPEALLPQEYLALFTGAICLQPYDQNDFRDRISGITLDALSAGCPIITLQGTWMARIVNQFQAGVVIDSSNPYDMLAAVQQVIADYDRYHRNALQAGSSLQEQHDAVALFKALSSTNHLTGEAA